MADPIKFKGTLVYIGKRESIIGKTGHEFVKRDIAVADDPNAQYPTVLVATLKKTQKRDNTTVVSERDLNRECEVEYFPDGRFYLDKKTGEKKAMAGNTAWKVNFTGVNGGSSAPAPVEEEPPKSIDELDDMPF